MLCRTFQHGLRRPSCACLHQSVCARLPCRGLAGAAGLKYRPDQARVPAGSREGGQWMSAETGQMGITMCHKDSIISCRFLKRPRRSLKMQKQGDYTTAVITNLIRLTVTTTMP